MNEFFRETEFGRSMKNKRQETNYRYKGQRIYKVTEDIPNSPLKKGDRFYLDNSRYAGLIFKLSVWQKQ